MKKLIQQEQKIAEVLIEKMFEIAGYNVSYREAVSKGSNWFNLWTITLEQQEKWMRWGAKYMHEELGIPLYLAERKMDIFNFNYGLKLIKKVSNNKV